jgi:hypothetical protein
MFCFTWQKRPLQTTELRMLKWENVLDYIGGANVITRVPTNERRKMKIRF